MESNEVAFAKMWLRNRWYATDTQRRVGAAKDVIADPLLQFL